MSDPDLQRFTSAQARVIDHALAELAAGLKQSHWMWYVFPQLEGLGRSETARHYAIRDLDQAQRYLADPLLGDRLRHCVRLVLQHKDKSANAILGSPDDMKFRSCLTLFRAAAASPSDRRLFGEALNQFYGGEPDARTLALLGLK